MEPERVPAVLAGAGGGIGLSNVDARLRATFGERYALRVESALGVGTTVIMTVPNLAGGYLHSATAGRAPPSSRPETVGGKPGSSLQAAEPPPALTGGPEG
jgi:hypothetical protein